MSIGAPKKKTWWSLGSVEKKCKRTIWACTCFIY